MKRIALAALLALAPAAGAQTLDRKVVPPAGPSTEVVFPAVQQRTLGNGLRVYVVERRNVPVVTMRLVVDAGSAADPAGRGGLAAFTAEMLDEGTTTRSSLQLVDELELLGADLSTGGGYDVATVQLNTLSRNVRPALGILADVVARPAFATAELERVRGQRLTALMQQQDQPVTLANRELAMRIFGGEHPYGRPLEGTPATLRRFSPQDLRAFHQQYYRPANARLIVVGDVRTAELIPQLNTAFAAWTGSTAQQVRYPAAPQPQPATRVYLIDKPGAAQSEVRIGHVGVARNHPDHFPLLVLNAVLGGQFTSRINLNLRENKGYTYGARSGWTQRREPGAFTAQAGRADAGDQGVAGGVHARAGGDPRLAPRDGRGAGVRQVFAGARGAAALRDQRADRGAAGGAGAVRAAAGLLLVVQPAHPGRHPRRRAAGGAALPDAGQVRRRRGGRPVQGGGGPARAALPGRDRGGLALTLERRASHRDTEGKERTAEGVLCVFPFPPAVVCVRLLLRSGRSECAADGTDMLARCRIRPRLTSSVRGIHLAPDRRPAPFGVPGT
jgi:predicted Zn-dependent peptidase